MTTIQWIQVDGATETDISGATTGTYTLATADAGKKIKVKVSFEDEDGTAEGPLTSDAYPSSATVTAAPVTNIAPASADEHVEADEDTDYTFEADDFEFTDADAGDSLASIKIVTLPASGTGTLTLSGTAIGSGDLPQTVLAAEIDDLKYSPPANLYGTRLCDLHLQGERRHGRQRRRLHDNRRRDGDERPGDGQARDHGHGAGGPDPERDGGHHRGSGRVAGPPHFGRLDTTIQWIQVDGATETDISGATNETYTLATADEGKKIKVKVSFEDDDGTAEGPLTSDAYPASATVTAAPVTNTAPGFSSPSVSRSIAENTAADVNVGAAVTATDADARRHPRLHAGRH